MERYRKALRGWIGKLTEGLRGGLTTLSVRLQGGRKTPSPRRAAAIVIALSLWTWAGSMDSSIGNVESDGEIFGEVHWYEG